MGLRLISVSWTLCTSHIDTHRERETDRVWCCISMSPGRMSLYVVHPVDREGRREGERGREGGREGGGMGDV